MIPKFDFLLLNGGNLVLSDNLNIIRNTLLISLSVIALNEKDISHIFAHKIKIICFERITDISVIFKGTEMGFYIFQHRISWAF